jgi:hypothetical protein
MKTRLYTSGYCKEATQELQRSCRGFAAGSGSRQQRNPILLLLFALALCAPEAATRASTQSYTLDVQPGLNLIANQLDHGSNTLNEVLPSAPDGALLYIYNNGNGTWSSSYYSAGFGSWMPGSLTLHPGQGALLQSTGAQSLTFTGQPHVPVLPVTFPAGAQYLLSRQTNDIGNYANIVGTAPADGATVFKLNTGTGTYDSYSFFGTLGWTPSEPIAAVGEALWIGSGGLPPPAPPSNPFTIYHSLPHQSLGNASVSLTPDGSLVVGNIGSSGQDGVSIGLPKSAGFAAQWSDSDPDSLPVAGAFLSLKAAGDILLHPDHSEVGELKVQESSGALLVTADFTALGATNRTVRAYLNGALVAEVSGQTGSVGSLFRKKWWKPTSGEIGWDDGPVLSLDWHLGSARMALNGGPTVDLDFLEVSPDGIVAPGSLTQVSLQGGNWPDLVITNETVAIKHGGLLHCTLGNAALGVDCPLCPPPGPGGDRRLPVNNLGSSGQDGVEIKWPRAKALDLAWPDLDPTNSLPVGAYLDATTVGPSNGVPSQVLMTTHIEKTGTGQYSLAVTHPGVASHTVEVWNGSNLVTVVHGQTGSGPVCLISGGLALDYHAETRTCTLTWFGPGRPPWEPPLDGRMIAPVQLQFSGLSTPVTGDRLVIRRDDSDLEPAAGQTDGVSVQLRASQIPQILLSEDSHRVSLGGLEVNNVGNGTVSLATDGAAVRIPSNIGEEDCPMCPRSGMRVTFGGASGFDGVLRAQGGLSVPPPQNSVVQAAFIGAAGTNAGDVVVLQAQALGSNWVYTAQLPGYGTSTYTVDAYLHGARVAHLINQTGGAVGSAAMIYGGGEPADPFTDFHLENTFDPLDPLGSLHTEHVLTWWRPYELPGVAFSLSGGPTVLLDELRLIPTVASSEVVVRAIELRASGITNLVLTSAAIKVFTNHVPVLALGGGSLRPERDVLTVANLGSSGQDGVSFNLGIAGDTMVRLAPLPGTLSAGTSLRFDVTGSFNGVPEQPIGSVSYTGVDPNSPWPLAITADFSSINSPSQLLIVRNNGADVGVFPGHTGPVGNVSSMALGIGKTFGQTKCIRGKYAANTMFQINGINLVGDELLILAESTGGHVDYHSSISVRASGIPAFSILGVDITPAPATYSGTMHTPLGSASLATSTNKPVRLTVGNLGSSGQDGVSITLGHAASAGVTLDPLGLTPVGAFVQLSALGSINGQTNQPLGWLRVTHVTGASLDYQVTADLSPDGSPTQRIEVWGNGAMLAAFAGHTGVVATVSSMPIGGGKLRVNIGPPIKGCLWDEFPAGTDMFINGIHFVGDQIRVLQESGPGADYLSALNITAAGVPSFTINGETVEPAPVIFSGFLNTPVGQADAYPDTSGALSVVNIGSSGQDGVSINLGQALSCEVVVKTNKLRLRESPTLSHLRFTARGVVSGQANQPLGYVDIRCLQTSDPLYEVTADLTPDGSPTQRIEVWSQGTLLAVFPGHTGVVGTVSAWPSSFGKLGPSSLRLPCYRGNWPWPTRITVNGIQFLADQLLILQETGPVVDYLSTFTVTAGDVDGFEIASESAVQAPITFSGYTNTALGTAILDSSTGDLSVANIGSSGQDGVTIDIGHALSCDVVVKTNKLRLRESPTLSHLRFSATGSVGGVTNHPLGYVDIMCSRTNPPEYEITPDFSAVGSSSQRIEVWSQGTMLAAFPGHTGMAATVSSWPIGFGKLGPSASRLPCYRGQWPWPTDFFVNGIHFVGDQLLILQETGTVVDYLSSFSITGANIDGFDIASESAVPFQPTLTATLSGTALTIQWSGGGLLQESTNLNDWSDLVSATSPYSTSSSPPKKFYRVRQ